MTSGILASDFGSEAHKLRCAIEEERDRIAAQQREQEAAELERERIARCGRDDALIHSLLAKVGNDLKAVCEEPDPRAADEALLTRWDDFCLGFSDVTPREPWSLALWVITRAAELIGNPRANEILRDEVTRLSLTCVENYTQDPLVRASLRFAERELNPKGNGHGTT
jgi:hypothetical protein